MQEDDQIYSRFLEGDQTAYDELMIRYQDHLIRFLHSYIHDWQDAEDLMIEAFARIMVKRPKIRAGGFKAYLFKTARNLATRFHEKSTRFQTTSLDEEGPEVADRYFTEDYILKEERNKTLEICLGRIDARFREALWLVYCEGMSYEEAAGVLKVTKKRVDHLLTKGKERLRKELAGEGVTEL